MCDYCSWIDDIVRPKIEDLPTICTNILNDPIDDGMVKKMSPKKYDPTILVHGTADSSSSEQENQATLDRIVQAAIEAYKELAKGCQSVEAVEMAIRRLENIESASMNDVGVSYHGRKNSLVIRDAAMMDSQCNAGSVGATTDELHPITLAKNVLQKTEHLIVVDNGIENLKISSENPSLNGRGSDDVLSTPPNSRNSEEIDVLENKIITTSSNMQKSVRLFGAIARDRRGLLACGNSTTDDRPESIERSSMTASGTILGCGIFANAKFCCSVSSEDRAVYEYAPARKIIERFQRDNEAGEDSTTWVRMEDAMNDELEKFFKHTGLSCVGVAGLGVDGTPEVAFTSRYFPWARCDHGIVTSGYARDQVFEKDVGQIDMPLDCECD